MTIHDVLVNIGDMPAWTLLVATYGFMFLCRFMGWS
jgi:hypothetical protein